MIKISLKDIKFKKNYHLAFSDEYITSYVSVNCVPTIYMSANTPRNKAGFVAGKTKRYLKTEHSKEWLTEEAFKEKYSEGFIKKEAKEG